MVIFAMATVTASFTILYEMYLDTGKKPEERTAERILRLAA